MTDGASKSLDVWGFSDSRFDVDERGDVFFTGARYPISGKVLPDLLPWARDVVDAPLAPRDVHASRYPGRVPERIAHPAFEAAARGALGAQHVSTDPRDRLRHGHGHSQEDMWAIHYGGLARVPDLVVRPEATEQVERIVAAAMEHGVCLVPYGGGTNVSDALRCPADEARCIVSVDLSRMNRVRWVDAGNHMACAEAGATGLEIDRALHEHGFTLGHEPDSYELSTLGGWIATNASGMKKNRYGNIEDLLLSVEAVTPAGRLDRPRPAPRESVGGDPGRWLLGSEGRLGIVTSATLKIFPLPELRRFDSVLFRSFEEGFAFLRDVQDSGVVPASIRLMDNLQFQFGQALKPRREGLRALESRLQKLYVLGVRGFEAERMVACTLLYEGSREEVAAQERSIRRLAARHHGMRAGAENGERGYQLTFAIAYIRDFMMSRWIIAESFETSVPWSRALELCANMKQRLWQEHAKRGLPGQPFVSCRVTQLYDTGVCIYFYFAFYYKGVANASEVYSELERAAREEILRAGGSLSHHHGVGKLRQRFLPEVFSPTALAWRERLKQAVDPENVLGCGNR
jgi:alkyldihydroxyacetonephosphate synthase